MHAIIWWYEDILDARYHRKLRGCLARQRTIPTERPPLVGIVSANLRVAWSAQQIPTAVNFGFLDRSRYFPFK
jgi:hypothetical protein